MENYSPGLPIDKRGAVKTHYPPAKVSLASQNKVNNVASSILLLTHDTTEIEVAASGQNVAGRWISRANLDASVAGTSVLTGIGASNFDFMVGDNTVRRFVVPISTEGATYGSIQGINRKAGLFPAVAFKTFKGTGSVLTAEF